MPVKVGDGFTFQLLHAVIFSAIFVIGNLTVSMKAGPVSAAVFFPLSRPWNILKG
jgi:hypothetical protein